jgi:hypothetical protein
MSSVLEKDPYHPHYLHIRANLIVLGVSKHWLNKKELSSAKHYLLLATKQRKFWSKAWVDLARVQSYIFGVNDETIYYIKQAELAGPFDFDVDQAVVDILLENWPTLASGYKPYFFKHVALATKHGLKFLGIFKSVQQRDQLHLLCLMVKTDKQYMAVRNSWMNTSFCT